MVEHPPTFRGRRRKTTVVVAIWALGIIAFLELLFAGIALAPRLLTTIRNSPSFHNQLSSAAASSTPTPASLPAQPLQTAQRNLPVETAATPPPLTKDVSTPDTPLQPAAAEASPQESSTLGIVSAKLNGSDDGSRRLVVTIKANPKIPIDVPQVKVQVYFYDTDGTEITPSKAQVTSSWTSPPVDWKDGDPELLEVRYLPDSVDTDIKFAGYVVAIYYKGDLQDYRAEPARLTKLFPLKYFIGTDE